MMEKEKGGSEAAAMSIRETEHYREFLRMIRDAVSARLEEDTEVILRTVVKNNSVKLDGLMIRPNGAQVVPNIYLNDMYPLYCEGISVEDIAERIIDIYVQNRDSFKPDVISDFSFEKMKDTIVLRLINYELNRDLLKGCPYLRFKDLAVTFHCFLQQSEAGVGTVRITNEHISEWGVTPMQLYECATVNMERLFPIEFSDIHDMLLEICRRSGKDTSEYEHLPSSRMYVLTNRNGISGASGIVYPGVLEMIHAQIGEDFFIIPSSVNEIIVVPDSIADADSLQAMIPEVNRTHVPKEEILSDNVYHYPDDDFIPRCDPATDVI